MEKGNKRKGKMGRNGSNFMGSREQNSISNSNKGIAKSNKGIAKCIVVAGAVILILGAIFFIKEYNSYKNEEIRFTINNEEFSGNKISDIENILKARYKEEVAGIDITEATLLEIDMRELDNLGFMEYMKLKGSNVNVNIKRTYDKDKLRDVLEEYNQNKEESISAKIVKNDKEYDIEEERIGTKVNVDKIVQDIIEEKSIRDLKEYKTLPEIVKADLQDIVNEANKYLAWRVEYNNGKEFTVPIENVNITEENEIETNTEFISKIVKELEKQYDNIGAQREFKTHSGEVVTVSGGTWGTLMDSAKELERLTEAFNNKESLSGQEPIMKQNYTEIGDTYIEVSISGQHIYVYENGELTMDSSIVTGDVNKRRGTPRGIYFVSERINGKYLTGDNYRTWVNKWMRLTNTGIGLHDAGWRASFGGNIYQGNGSHGCVNLPKSFAYKLFERVKVGMPVIIY